MRWLIPLALLTTACSKERSFDERFNDTATEIERRASKLDRQVANESVEPNPE